VRGISVFVLHVPPGGRYPARGAYLDAVAARAHVSKATLYRRWSGKATLVARALKRTRQPITPTVDTGSLRGDFAVIVARFDDRRASEDTAMMRSLMHAAHTIPELMRALREVLVEPEREDVQRMLSRAVARGEVFPDPHWTT
jgi:AcrR family transcriptional regulator